ncbi:CLUMA_CG013114, isoform A [Clunio marinus]|uniref:CLUMA_CG013114, isoform A n=1 Tax=Clunio marinus TaxID=568069 RepID=A0A1J1IL49_9DIPT|nr:CLUMA_CG013114, isoform A [Clunio marinus]
MEISMKVFIFIVLVNIVQALPAQINEEINSKDVNTKDTAVDQTQLSFGNTDGYKNTLFEVEEPLESVDDPSEELVRSKRFKKFGYGGGYGRGFGGGYGGGYGGHRGFGGGHGGYGGFKGNGFGGGFGKFKHFG